MATTITTTAELLQAAIAHLRQAGHEAEARAVEALLQEREPPRRRPTTPRVEGVVPIAEVAKQLGTSRAAVRRRIDLGMLVGEPDPETGTLVVTRQSFADYLEGQALIERIGQPIGGIEIAESEPTFLWEMIAQGIRQDELRVAAELAAEAREDEERAAKER